MTILTDVISIGVDLCVMYLTVIPMIYLHEGGHYLAAKMSGFKVTGIRQETLFNLFKVPTGVHFSDDELPNMRFPLLRRATVTLSGILLGFIPVGFYSMFADELFIVVLVVGYAVMCGSDLKKMTRYVLGTYDLETPKQ